jgi:hypothetical protein
MARTKGSKNKLRKEFIIDDLETFLSETVDTTPETDDEDSSDNVVLIDSEGSYGFKTYKYGYELHTRRKYEHDTMIETISPKTREVKKVYFKAGEFGPWQLSTNAFHTTLQSLLLRAKRLMVKEALSEEQDISNLVQIIDKSESRILSIVNGH